MRPIRFYPEIVVRAIDSPGAEQILESLFMSEGDECRSFDASVNGVRWADLAAAFMSRGLGTAIAYADEAKEREHAVQCNPSPDQIVHTDRIFLIVKADRQVTAADIRATIAGLETQS